MKKIALPTKDDGCIDSHFGHCQFYTICSLDENGQPACYERMESPVGCGCKSNIAPRLHEMGVEVMLAGNMGDGAVKVLGNNHIKVVRGCTGKVEEVVQAYLEGRLDDSGITCHEHECGGITLPDSIEIKF